MNAKQNFEFAVMVWRKIGKTVNLDKWAPRFLTVFSTMEQLAQPEGLGRPSVDGLLRR
ncbi:hypothetical protein ACSSVY_004142, partial [Roseovarius sp. MBR-51]